MEDEAMGLFQRKPATPLEVAAAKAKKVQDALDEARAGVGKVAQQHEAAVAVVEARAQAFEVATAAAVAAVAEGSALPATDLDALEDLYRRAQRDEVIVRQALEQQREALKPLIETNEIAQKFFADARLIAVAEKFRTKFVELMAVHDELVDVTYVRTYGHPNLTMASISDDALMWWDAAFNRWTGTGEQSGTPVLG